MKTKNTEIETPLILQNNKFGLAEYEHLYNDIVIEGKLEPKEHAVFIAYCCEYGNYIQLEMDLKKEGLISIAGNGTEIPNPKYNMKLSAYNSMMKSAMQLGLTPKTKTKTITKVELTPLQALKKRKLK